MTKPATKKTPTSQSLAARATKGSKDTPKGSGPSLAPVPLPVSLSQGVAELVRLTGLEEPAVVRHLLSSALFWCGLNGYGRRSFEFLLEATMGKEGMQEFLEEATGTACAIEMEAAVKVAWQRGREADAAFPGDWPAKQAGA